MHQQETFEALGGWLRVRTFEAPSEAYGAGSAICTADRLQGSLAPRRLKYIIRPRRFFYSSFLRR